MVKKKLGKRENGLSRFLVLVQKELSLITSDKQALLLILILPIVGVVAVGMNDAPTDSMMDMLVAGRQVNMGVVNLDTSVGDPTAVLAEEFISILSSLDGVNLYEYTSQSAADEAMFYEQIQGYIVIPDGFETNMSAHLPAIIHVYADNINLINQPLILKRVNDAINTFKVVHGYMDDEINYRSNDFWKVDSPLFVSMPMVLIVTLMASGLMLASQSIVGDNPLMRIALSPASRFEIVSGKIVAYLVIHMVQSAILLAVPMLFFRMSFIVNPIIVWAYSVFISYAGAAMGCFLSSISKTKLQGSQMFLVGFMSLFILGTGYFIDSPILTTIFPLMPAMRGFSMLAFKGLGFMHLLPVIVPQLVFGTVFYIMAYLVVHRKKGLI